MENRFEMFRQHRIIRGVFLNGTFNFLFSHSAKNTLVIKPGLPAAFWMV